MERKERKRLRAALLLALVGSIVGYSGVESAIAAEGTTGQTYTIVVDGGVSQAEEEAKWDPQRVQIITAEDIEKTQAKSVEEVIFQQTGVSRTVDAMGRVGVSIRGADPRHTLILVDGQPVIGEFAKYLGSADEVTRLGAENIERIEVVQGAASAKYGADAIGGVVNIITKKSGDSPTVQLNVEGRQTSESTTTLPNSNFFLRADTGRIGKSRISLYGSKRDIMPVYAAEARKSVDNSVRTLDDSFEKNSLRYYGTAATIGITGAYTLNDNQTLDWRWERFEEDLKRFVKRTESVFEPQLQFKRKAQRDTMHLGWSGRSGENTDWKFEITNARIREQDVALKSNTGQNVYEGQNTLTYLDTIDHKQMNINATVNHAINDEHVLTVGFGTMNESGQGSRLKQAPQTYLVPIDPWDYDKALQVNKKGIPSSEVHDYKLKKDGNGHPVWDSDYELYGYESGQGNNYLPSFTYADYLENFYYKPGSTQLQYNDLPADKKAAFDRLTERLQVENNIAPTDSNANVLGYYYYASERGTHYFGKDLSLNGYTFRGASHDRDNKVKIGEAKIRKQYFVLSDLWTVNDRTTVVPVVRLDHSSLFGSQITFGLGSTYLWKGNPNTRIKANIGTAYAEPGMGELYYNWEMYGSTPMGLGEARLGWYWVGNPDLKPEKSLNMDIGFEIERGNTSWKASLFHNKIRDYLSVYFTGSLMDFYPHLNENTSLGIGKYQVAPDMIYSFKNIGRVSITGADLEVRKRWNSHWSTRLGYTYLHTLNESDPMLPKQLLDKPTHKIDVGIQYDDEKRGWMASLTGSYYIGMLDSNTLSNGGNYMSSGPSPDSNRSIITYRFAKGRQEYEKKTYGIWNLMVQKRFSPDAMAYLAIDNVFNYRDDNRAIQERVYRAGLNFKFSLAMGTTPESIAKHLTSTAGWTHGYVATVSGAPFIQRQLISNAVPETTWYGMVRAGHTDWEGENRPPGTTRPGAFVNTAQKNLTDRAGGGWDSELRLGVQHRIGDTTALEALGTLKTQNVYDMDEGHKPQGHLKKLSVIQSKNQWDWELGRLRQAFGATGYWFNDSFDGLRATWTRADDKLQFRVGAGNFRHSMGIKDSAYTSLQYDRYERPITAAEFLGFEKDGFSYRPISETPNTPVGKLVNMHKHMIEAMQKDRALDTSNEYQTVEAELEVLRRFYDAATAAYGEGFLDHSKVNAAKMGLHIPNITYTYTDATGKEHSKTESPYVDKAYYKVDWSRDLIAGAPGTELDTWWKQYGEQAYTDLTEIAMSRIPQGNTFKRIAMTKDEFKQALYKKNYLTESWGMLGQAVPKSSNVVNRYFHALVQRTMGEDQGTTLPRSALEKVVGVKVQDYGLVVNRAEVAPVEKAIFAEGRYQVRPRFGIALWGLYSVGSQHILQKDAQGQHNLEQSFTHPARVWGIGARYDFSESAHLTVDYGQNTSRYARYLHGDTAFRHIAGSSEFIPAGHTLGSIPQFWMVRLDIGRLDPTVPGSWQAYADYKHMERGAFLGGAGLDSLPDRYLDGIRSFTFGVQYVPAAQWVVEGHYTFGAKGLQERVTLYGNEKFRLGNLTRIQITYRF